MLSRTVEVQIDVVDRSNKPPVWDQTIYGPIYVKENTAVGETVTTVKARSVLCPPKFLRKNVVSPKIHEGETFNCDNVQLPEKVL